MTTSFIRLVVVLGLVRQALGTQQLPPAQVITSLALLITLAVMAPVWKQSYDEAIAPYNRNEIELLPAFVLSELKVAFLIGFQIYLPFLIIDLVVAVVMVSMGMLMLPPAPIALPLKLLLFVLVDGWHLVGEMLLVSFGPVG